MEFNDDSIILEQDLFDEESFNATMEETEIDSIAIMKSGGNDVIEQAFMDLSEKNIALKACQIAWDHSKLQVLAITQSLHETISKNTHLESKLSKSEVQLTELEAKLKFISAYEKEEVEHEVESVRESLLQAANDQIAQLQATIDAMRAEHDHTVRIIGDENIHLQSKNSAMHDEIKHLSTQLATRAVMYKALTHKYQDETRLHTSIYSDKEKENIELKAKLEHLTAQYETCIKEKTEIDFSYREIVQIKSTLEQQLTKVEEERLVIADELDTAVSNNRQLQLELNVYQSSDPEDVQTRLAEEAAEIRREASAQTDGLRRQINDLQRQVSRMAEEREQLVGNVRQLTAEVEEKSHLLDQLGHSGNAEHSHQQSRSLFHFSESSIYQQQNQHQHHLPFDETISQLSAISASVSPSTRASARYAPAGGTAAGLKNLGADLMRTSTDTIESRESTDSWSIHQLGQEEHPDKAFKDGNRPGDQGDEANVLQASREGLPAGIAFQHSMSEHMDVNSALQSLLAVLEELAASLQSAAPDQQSLSQVAHHAVHRLLHSDIFASGDIDLTLSESLQSAVGRLLKKLVAKVHTHLGAPTEAEEAHSFSDTHTHVHFTTPEAQRSRHQISFEDSHSYSYSVERMEKKESNEGRREEMGQEQGATLPHRHESSDALQEEVVWLKRALFQERQKYRDIKADNKKASKLLHLLLSKVPEAHSLHAQHQIEGNHPLQGDNQASISTQGHAHHHRTVHIHSESDLKGSGFTQHQTRDVTVSLESGDSVTPSQLQAQLQLLQASFDAAQQEKQGLLEQLNHFHEKVRALESFSAESHDLGRAEAEEHCHQRILLLETEIAALKAEKEVIVETAVTTARVSELWARVSELQAALDVAVREKEALAETVAAKDAQISHHASERERHQAETVAAAAEVSAHKSHAEALQQSLIENEARISELQKKLDEAQLKLAELSENANKSETEKVTLLRCQVTDLEQQNDDLVSKLQAIVQETETSVTTRLSLLFNEQRSGDRSTLRALEDSAAEQTQRLQTLTEEVNMRRRQNVELEAELFQMQNLLDLQQRRAHTQETQSRALLEQVEQLQAQLETHFSSQNSTNQITTSGEPTAAPYVLQGQFQETVTSLQIQMEAVKNINTLVVENIRDRISQEDREAAEREMHSLRLELEQKITSVNEQLNRLREQQLLQQEAQARQLQDALQQQALRQQAQEQKQKEQEEQQQIRDQEAAQSKATASAAADAVPAIPMMPVQEHEAQLLAGREAAQHLQQRLLEIEGINAQLMEHNMTLLRQLQQVQVQLQQHIEGKEGMHEEKDRERERDNGSVFSIDKSAYQGQITQLSQQAVLLEQQRMQIERFEENFEIMRQQMNQLRSRYQAKLAKQKEANEEKLRRQQAQFNTERSDLVVLVNEECERIIAEVHTLIQHQFARHSSVECSVCGHVNSTVSSDVGSTPDTQRFAQATPPLVPPPPPKVPPPPPPPRPAAQPTQGAQAPYAKSTPPSARQYSEEKHTENQSGNQDSRREHREQPIELVEHQRQVSYSHEKHQHSSHQMEEHINNAHHEVKHSAEFELRHAEGSSIPVHNSLRSSLSMPTHSGASPARKPISSKTAAIIAAHSRPPAGHNRDHPQAPGQGSSAKGSFSRLLSSVTSLQSHLSASSNASLQGLVAENVSVLAGPKPSYANPTLAYTSRQRSPTVRARDSDIHPPSSSGDINAGGRRRSGPTVQTSQHTVSPPRRRSSSRSAHNTHSAERTVDWSRSGEHKSGSGGRSSSGGKKMAFVYPDSLSPGRTLELVHELVGRSLTQEHDHQHQQEHLHQHEQQRHQLNQRGDDNHPSRIHTVRGNDRHQNDQRDQRTAGSHEPHRVRSSI